MTIIPEESSDAKENGIYDFKIEVSIFLDISKEDGYSDMETCPAAHSSTTISHIGENYPLGALLKDSYMNREVNYKKYNGLIICVKDRTPDRAYENAWSEWGNFNPDSDNMNITESEDYHSQLKSNDGALIKTIKKASYVMIDKDLITDDFFDVIIKFFSKNGYSADDSLEQSIPGGYVLWVKDGVDLHFGSGEEVNDFEENPGQIKFPFGY